MIVIGEGKGYKRVRDMLMREERATRRKGKIETYREERKQGQLN